MQQLGKACDACACATARTATYGGGKPLRHLAMAKKLPTNVTPRDAYPQAPKPNPPTEGIKRPPIPKRWLFVGNDHEGLIKVVTGIDKDPEPGTAPSCGAPPQSRVTWRFLGKTGKGAVVRSMEVLGFVLAWGLGCISRSGFCI